MPVTTTTYTSIPEGTTWMGGAPTIVDDADYVAGTTKAFSLADLGDNTTADAFLPNFTTTAGTSRILFRYNIESETCCDPGIIYVDGVQRLNFKGVSGWSTVDAGTYSAGTHTLQYQFTKDSSASLGFDNMHIGSMYVVDGDISNLQVTNLQVTNNGVDAIAYWNSPFHGQSGFSYEWTIDGGTNVYSTTNQYIEIPGLNYNTSYNFQVRPVWTGYGNGAWADATILLASFPKVLGSVRSEMWSANNTQGVISNNEIILSNGSSRTGGITSRITMPITDSSLFIELWVGSGADRLDLGVLDPSVSAGTPGMAGWGNGLPISNPSWGFTGFSMDIWGGTGVTPYINGVAYTAASTQNMAATAWHTYEVRYSILAGNITISLYRSSVLIHSATGPAPSYTMGRATAIGGSGGISALFKARNTPQWTIVDLTFNVVSNIKAYPLSDRINYVWDKTTGATEFEYSLDGGTTPVSTGANNFVELTGLSVGQTIDLVVRAKSSTTSTQTGWSPVASATTTATPLYSSFVMDKDPALYLPLDEASGNYLDISRYRNSYAPIAENRGLEPLTSDSTQAVGSVVTPARLGIARGPVIPEMITSTWTCEMWVNIPPNTVNFEGSFFKFGDNNGFGVGAGNFGTQTNSGRNLIGITEGNSWMATSFNFTNGTWRPYHLVVTRNGTNYTYFINGTQVATTTSANYTDPTGQVHIGTTVGSPGRVITGGVSIDAVAFYPSILTGAQITENYTAGARMYQPSTPESVPLNGAAAVRWSGVPGATSYDISTDGGSTFITQAAAPSSTGALEVNSIQLTRPNGTPVDTVVRAKTAYNTGPWSNPSTTTPSATRYVIHWDNFDKPPGTSVGSPQVGGSYTLSPGPWSISDTGRLYTPTSADLKLLFPGSFNFDWTFNIPVAPNNNGGVIFRYTDASNYMMFFRSGNGETNSTYRLRRNANGNATDLFATASAEGVPKVTDVIRIVGKDNWIYVYINGVRLTQREDHRAFVTPAPTTMGFYSWASPNLQMDNAVVWNTHDFDVLGPVNGKTAHVYKGRDNYNDDLGNTP